MKTFTEGMRYEYDLTPDSLIMDIGAYEGNFTNLLCEKYDCAAIVFEPVPAFYKQVVKKLSKWPLVLVFNLGVGGETYDTDFSIKGAMTGISSVGNDRVRVNIRDIAEVLRELESVINNKPIDLVKINSEGSEYPMLERMLDGDLVRHFKNIQIQFHSVVGNALERRDTIRVGLAKTHELTWLDNHLDNGWENWRLK